MNTLKFLDQSIRDLISSEVTIPSLPDAIRECIENSIDADSNEIRCSFDLQNLSFSVIDNGKGMSLSTLDSACHVYCTSKVQSLGDLVNCTTYGFRGQALYSISNISSLNIISKTSDCNHFFSNVFYLGKQQLLRPTTISYDLIADEIGNFNFIKSHGSIIMVKNLYCNLPVRRSEALKTQPSKIIDAIRSIIFDLLVINPHITLQVTRINNGYEETICKYNGIYDHEIKQNLIHSRIFRSLNHLYDRDLKFDILSSAFGDFSIEILIGTKSVPSSKHQNIYFNSKKVIDNSIFTDINKKFQNVAIAENMGIESDHNGKAITYFGKSLIGFPVIILKIKGPMSLSDRLQDPSKNIFISNNLERVKVRCKELLVSFFTSKKIKTHDSSITKKAEFDDILICSDSKTQGRYKGKRLHRYQKLSQKSSIDIKKNEISLLSTSLTTTNKHDMKFSEYFPSIDKIKITKNYIKNCKVISQVDNKFILVKAVIHKPILLLVDQHACDERIKVETYFQKFVDSICGAYYESADSETDSLSEVLDNKIEIKDFSVQMDSEYKNNFFSWGFKFFNDKSNTIYVTEIPRLLKSKLTKDNKNSKSNADFIRKVMLQHYYDIAENRKIKSCISLIKTKNTFWWNWLPFLPDIIIDLINSKACRSAIKFGDSLSASECRSLLSQLSKCRLAFQCAHGRPSIVPFVDLSLT